MSNYSSSHTIYRMNNNNATNNVQLWILIKLFSWQLFNTNIKLTYSVSIQWSNSWTAFLSKGIYPFKVIWLLIYYILFQKGFLLIDTRHICIHSYIFDGLQWKDCFKNKLQQLQWFYNLNICQKIILITWKNKKAIFLKIYQFSNNNLQK